MDQLERVRRTGGERDGGSRRAGRLRDYLLHDGRKRDQRQHQPAQVPAVETMAGDQQESRRARDKSEFLLGAETRPQGHPIELLQGDPQDDHE